MRRILSLWLTRIRKRMFSATYPRGDVIPVTTLDSSGFPSAYASSYYSQGTGKTHKRFLRVALAIDTEKHVILASAVTQHPTHDAALAGNRLKQSHRTIKASCYVTDKRYGAEWIHRLIREDIKADSPVSIRKGKRRKIRGKYRRKLTRIFDWKKCHWRNIAETAFSVLKRTLRKSLKTRKIPAVSKENQDKTHSLQCQKNDPVRMSNDRERAFLQSQVIIRC